MGITEIVRGNGDDAPPRTGARIAWFVAIWSLSTCVFLGAASLLHLIVPR
ncbi:DUF2474 domain-containing protein [Komagataeibacter intermedius]|uniref:DUF2474 domain-containing protein n=2 Tax=Komagataeibacter intermedius TaxID=66229 RepID=A0A0N1N5K1_9PROT|nr:DUF2474 domain-containing protein [Komagataeibacter intermedius]KPH87987.1 hypothetical protein GLUCOINTEAF2_0201916 [Komagataeibacter intermedius AF2]MCF3635955.1 DUF2474 domain-containing protein [Komagataeibacter intermedius]GAN86482.1 hypothetical protein Gain_0027_157 [Komagataeibacter intermedius TF2]GBQ68419.1 hypothetical protein AA0521_1241 [Komagataeibacter intermedius NRIC 0521]